MQSSATSSSAAPAKTATNNLAAEQKAQMQQQAPILGPKYTGEPISVNLKDVDLKDFFRLIHEISGLNVVLDPNVHGNSDHRPRRRSVGPGVRHRPQEQRPCHVSSMATFFASPPSKP